MSPRVSVIVPLYNVEDYVAECLHSLARQTFRDWEAICVDDVSTDRTLQKAREAAGADERFAFVARNENGGLSAARNTGLDAAKGDFVMFLDSDDYLADRALERLVGAADAADADLVDFTGKAFYESEEMARQRPMTFYEQRDNIEGVHTGAELFSLYQQKEQYCCSACFHLISRALLERAGLRFKPGILHEDELFSPLLHAHATRALFVNEGLYLRRVRADSITTAKRGVRNIASFFAITEELEDWLEEHASEHTDAFVGAFAQRINELRDIMARDIAACDESEVAAFASTLDARARARFALHGLQRARTVVRADSVRNELDEVYASKTWRLGNTIARIPRIATRIARKRQR